ncbi:MAG: hypothetical protein ABJZ55_17490 [Fuerstiella sp.]
MSFSRSTILTALFAITAVAASVDTVNACGGRGRSVSYSRSYSSHSSYRAPSHSYSYSAPTQHYSTPSYQYSQPISVVRSQPIQQFQPAAPIQRIQTVSQQQPFQGGQPGLQQQAPQPSVQQQLQVQQAPQQPVVQPPVASQTAAMSALQALGGFAPPVSSPVAPAQQPAPQPHVGSWTAALGNGSSVTLTLEEDGHFRWVATNTSGQASSFEGNYTIANGSLSLLRANDNQQLAGSMNTNGNNAFSFQVGGTNSAALNFQRS